MDRHIENRARSKVFDVDISSVHARGSCAYTPHAGRRGYAHRAEERFVHGDHNSFSHVSGLLVPVDGNDPLPEGSELIGQSTGSRALSVVTIAVRQLDLQNLHL